MYDTWVLTPAPTSSQEPTVKFSRLVQVGCSTVGSLASNDGNTSVMEIGYGYKSKLFIYFSPRAVLPVYH